MNYGRDVCMVVLAAREGISQVITATGATPDEAIERLYQHVYASYGEREKMQRPAS
jgi:hypothetical protein